MDIDMPIKDGIETSIDIFKFYSDRNEKKNCPTIVTCTAYVGDDIKNQCF